MVRDSKGNPVDNLTIDDFQLSDNGKPQLISKFSIERLEKTPPPGDAAAIPTRFVAYLFDDVHMTPRDLIETRDAVTRRIDAASDPRQRIAIYSTSGITLQDFTADKSQLHAALSSLHIGPAGGFTSLYQDECPSMTYYEAHLVYNDRDQDAIALANADATACGATPDELERVVQDRAREVLTQGDRTTQASLDAIRNVTARLASMLGKRTIVLISPRLVLLNNSRDQQTSIIDGAIHANVVIGALDRNDVSEHEPQAAAGEIVTNTAVLSKKLEYAEDEASISSSVVESIAEG
ncbi:MAG TPA: VWA domain-containing protein, partial [Bryobacteraceae bacterium]|nr:VWA domain-containing protein [Bryobacteraceae bacterium]